MNKLFIGSMGTLGIITEVTLKLRPLPKDEKLVLVTIPEKQHHLLDQFVANLLDSPLDPASLELFNPPLYRRLFGEEGFGLAIAFEDRPQAVDYQTSWLVDHLPPGLEAHILGREEAHTWWQNVAHLPPNPAVDSSNMDQVVLKIGSLNLDVLAILERIHQLAKHSEANVEAHGGLGHGLTMVYIKESGPMAEHVIEELRAFVNQRQGYVILRHASLAFRQKVGVWGAQPAHFFLLDGIRRRIDPHFTLNPKRFVGGL